MRIALSARIGDAGKGILAQHSYNFMPALATRNDQAAGIISRLNNAATDSQYTAELSSMQKEGIDPSEVLNHYVPGFSVPENRSAWQVRGRGAQAALGEARQMVAQYNTSQSGRVLSQPVVDEKQAAAVKAGPAGGVGAEGAQAVTVYDGSQGVQFPLGSADLEAFRNPVTGKGSWHTDNAETRTELDTMKKDKQVEGATEGFKTANHFYKAVNEKNDDGSLKMFGTAAGLTEIVDKFSAMARKSTETSNASGNASLARILHTNTGTLGEYLNNIAATGSEMGSWLNSHGPGFKVGDDGQIRDANGKVVPNAPRMSDNMIKGIRDVASFEYDLAKQEAQQRLTGPAKFMGRNGMLLSNSGWDDEVQKLVAPAALQGREDRLNDIARHPAIMEGSTRINLREGTGNAEAVMTPRIKKQAEDQTIPSPGHENPPPGGAVPPPKYGNTQERATAELQFARQHNNGISSDIKPPDPNAATQRNLTQNAASFLSMTRTGESNGDNAASYSLINGGKRIQNYDDHPRQLNRATNSTASGAYQITAPTWDDMKAKYGAWMDRDKDGNVTFTPQNQDKAAWYLAQDRYKAKTGGSLEQDLNDPRILPKVFTALIDTWSSFPGGK